MDIFICDCGNKFIAVSGAKFCDQCGNELPAPMAVDVETDIEHNGNRVVTGMLGNEEVTVIFRDGKIAVIDRG